MIRLLYLGILICGAYATPPTCEDGTYNIVSGTQCRYYRECKNGVWFLKQCRIGDIFNPTQLKFISTKEKCSDRSTKCTEGDTYAHPGSNNLYHRCMHGRISTRYCGAGEIFNPTTESCQINIASVGSEVVKSADNARTRRSAKDECTDGWKQRDGNSCRSYRECVNGVIVLKTCPDCMNYDEVTKSCRFNVNYPCESITTPTTPTEQPTTETGPSTQPPTTDTKPSTSSTESPTTVTEPTTTDHKSTEIPTTITEPTKQPTTNPEPDTTVPTIPSPSPSVSCINGQKISVKDPKCKHYEECVNGKFIEKSCPWSQKFDMVKNECEYWAFHWKIRCNK